MAKRERLTEDRVRKLKAPDPSGKQTVYRDRDVRYLAVLVSGTTDRKSYVVSYGARFQRRVIGDVTDMSLQDARAEALRMKELMKKGIDPRKPQTNHPTPGMQSSTITLRQLLDRRIKDDKQPLRKASVKGYTNVLNRHLSDWLDNPISDITPDAVHDRHKAIFKGVKKTEDRTGRRMADFTMHVLHGLFTYAKGQKGSDKIAGLPEANPVAGLEWYINKHRPRDTYIEDNDLPGFWSCLSDPEINPIHATMIKVMLLTGLRIGTTRQLTWKHVDLDNRVIKCPAEIMKGKRPHELPICNGTFEIMQAWRKRGVERSGYLFPSSRRGQHANRPDFGLIAKKTGIDVSAHDLRRTFARAGKKAKVSRWQMADMLSHSAGTITDGYSGTLEADDLREPMQAVTDHLLRLCNPAPVIVMPARRKKAA
jgi:integrase